MKRFRIRAVGLGLALVAGSAVAADEDWQAPGQPPVGAPALLPLSVNGGPAKSDPGPLWLPATVPAVAPAVPAPAPAGGAAVVAQSVVPSVLPPAVTPAAGVSSTDFISPPPPQPPAPQPPAPQPPAQPTGWQPESGGGFGPRADGVTGPLPAIPVPPDEPPVARPTGSARQPLPIPAPRPLEAQPADPKPPAPPMMVPPTPPDIPPPSGMGLPLPAPRPVESPPRPLPPPVAQLELQPAPPGYAYPVGAYDGAKPGSFGSAPIRLSGDFPPLRELIQLGHNHDDITLTDDGSSGGPLSRYFVSGEYLLWWLPGFPTPVLATTNANTALNGYLGEPGTTAVIGPGALVNSTRSGVRLRAGAWLDDCGTCGIDAGFFILPTTSSSAATNPAQYPLVTRPVYVPNLIPGTNTPLGENGEAVGVPGILRGSVAVHADSELWGADVTLRKSLFNTCDARAELFAGYRYLNLSESLTVTEDITVIGPGGARVAVTDPIGTRVLVQDRFVTHNEFNGGQIGGLYERHWGRWDLDARGSLGLGDTYQVLNIDGYQVRDQPGAAPMTFRGGLLAAGPNLGRFTQNRFSVVPELTLNVGYHVTPNVRVFAGYNFLLWTNVIRPGDQIDHTVDLTFVPNALPAGFSGQYRPHPLFAQRDLAINGIQFGVDVRW